VKVRAVLNPRAGVAAERALEAVRQGRPSWKELAVFVTTGPGDATALAREAARAGIDLVLAVGGDGTANEAAQGLFDSETALGIVPVGSGNGLARCLRIPLDPARALAALEDGVTRPIDVGLLNGSPFLNVGGAGFDAVVGADFHAAGRGGGRRGVLSYVLLSLLRVARYRAEPLRLEADGGAHDLRPFLVCLANGPQYGAGAVIAPGARLDDGRLDIVVIDAAAPLVLLANVPRLFAGTIHRSRLYRRLSASRATLHGGAPFAFHRDGEPESPVSRLEVGVRPRALRLRVPRAVTEDARGPFGAEPGREP
jgi:YegS/Rv2252/BmrU family lipid kinase